MSTENFTITIQGDSEGYVTFECPYCDSEFKLQAGEYQNDDEPFEELFCPYCGLAKEKNEFLSSDVIEQAQTSVYKGYKQDKIEMRGDRAEMSDFPLYLNTVAGGLDRRDQTIGGFSFVVKIYAVPVIEIIG